MSALFIVLLSVGLTDTARAGTHTLAEAASELEKAGFPQRREFLYQRSTPWPDWVQELLIAMDDQPAEKLKALLNSKFPGWRKEMLNYQDGFDALLESPYTQGHTLAHHLSDLVARPHLTAYALLNTWTTLGLMTLPQTKTGESNYPYLSLDGPGTRPYFELQGITYSEVVIPNRVKARAPRLVPLVKEEYLRWKLSLLLYELAHPGYLKGYQNDPAIGEVRLGRTELALAELFYIGDEKFNTGKSFAQIFDPSWKFARDIRAYFSVHVIPSLNSKPSPIIPISVTATAAAGLAWVLTHLDTCRAWLE